ncbi:MAG: hypothetical protein VYE77_05635 [Planctomycetota bacterium]|nr:hypothetical protein [Planctomycetota bacterium]
MRLSNGFVLAGILAGTLTAQEPTTWLQDQYSSFNKLNISRVLGDATSAGVVTNANERLALKNAFRALRAKQRSGRPEFLVHDFPFIQQASNCAEFDAAMEKEDNDGWMMADDMGTETIAIGDCGGENDIDSWKFNSAGGFYTIAVNQTGMFPISDSVLFIRNYKGDPIAFNDDVVGSGLSQIHMYLPAGTYYADVCGFNGLAGGSYELSVTHDPVSIVSLPLPLTEPSPLEAPLGPFPLQTPGAGIAHNVYEFTLQSDARVHLNTEDAAHSGVDTVLVIQRADGLILFTGDDSVNSAFDAAADIDLPAGTYYAYLSEFSGASVVAIPPDPVAGFLGQGILISAWQTQTTFADICTAGQVTLNLIGNESVRLARINLATPQKVTLLTNDGFATPVGDTVLSLLDRDLDFLFDVDDDDPFDPSRGGYSRISVSLPAGIYYAAITPFVNLSGGATLSAVCNPFAATGTANYGDFTGDLLGFGDIATYNLPTSAPSTVRFLAGDYEFGLLGPDGQLMSVTHGGPEYPQAGESIAGDCTLFMWDRYDYSGPLSTNFVESLHLDAAGAVTTNAKVGDLVVLLGQFGPQIPAWNLNPSLGERGMICLDPTNPTLITIDVLVAGTTGAITWFTPPPLPAVLSSYDFQMQQIDLHMPAGWGTVPSLITFRNALGI